MTTRYSIHTGLAGLLLILCIALSAHGSEIVLTHCNNASFLAAVAAGGEVRIDCDGTILLRQESIVTNEVRIDATGRSVTLDLSGIGGTGRGFAVQSNGVLSLVGLKVRGARSTAPEGGGAIYNKGALFLRDCEFFDNHVQGGNTMGGAVLSRNYLAVTNCLFLDNEASHGGAVCLINDKAFFVNCTFATNGLAQPDPFGFVDGSAVSAAALSEPLLLRHCTFVGNRFVVADGIIFGYTIAVNGPIQLENSIMADPPPEFQPRVLVRGSHNVVAEARETDFLDPPNLIGTDPKVSVLADNGGPTRTVSLLPLSPAINYSDPAVSPATDQRGFPRPVGFGSDAGAFESPLAGAPLQIRGGFTPLLVGWGMPARLTFTLTNTSDHAWTDLTWTNELPSGIAVSAAPDIIAGCGQVTAAPGSDQVVVSGVNLGVGQQCQVSLNLIPFAIGSLRVEGFEIWEAGIGVAQSEGASLVVSPAPTVETPAVTVPTAQTIELRSALNPLGSPVTAYFEYGLTTEFSQQTEAQTFPGDSPIELRAVLEGLDPMPTYFRAVVISELGRSVSPMATIVRDCDPENLQAAISSFQAVTLYCSGPIWLSNTLAITRDLWLTGSSPDGHPVLIARAGAGRLLQITNTAEVRLNSIALAYGRARNGGAIYNEGVLRLMGCSFSNNMALKVTDAEGLGGAIYSPGFLAATNCLFLKNEAPTAGGAVFLAGNGALVNCTFATNTSLDMGSYALGPGGAALRFQDNPEPVLVRACTFVGNSSAYYPIVYAFPLRMENSIMAYNQGRNLSFSSEVYGTHNIVDDTSGLFVSQPNLTHTDPLLYPLADNGGGTLTCALRPGSPALDWSDALTTPATDQRGVARPIGAAADAGAFESPFPDPGLLLAPAFTPDIVLPGRDVRLEFAVQSTNGQAWSDLACTNRLPGGLRISANPVVSNDCGQVQAPPGGEAIIVHGVDLGPGAEICRIGLNVSVIEPGQFWTEPTAVWQLGRAVAQLKTAELVVWPGPEPRVNRVKAEFPAAGLIELQAWVSPSGSFTTAYFEYGLTPDLGSVTPAQSIGDGFAYINLTALVESSELIYFRIVATNQYGVRASPVIRAVPGWPIIVCDQSSLRDAIQAGGLVRFECDGTITLTNTLLIDKQVILDATGRDVRLSGNQAVRLFEVSSGGSLLLTNLTLEMGHHQGAAGTPGQPGDTALGGCIQVTDGELILVSCLILTNRAQGGKGSYLDNGFAYPGGDAKGGAIYAANATVILKGTLGIGNQAVGGEGGVVTAYEVAKGGDALGGFLYASNSLVMIDTSHIIHNNSFAPGADDPSALFTGPRGFGGGGALYLESSDALVLESEFAGNEAIGESSYSTPGEAKGGAVHLKNGSLSIERTVIWGNRAQGGSGWRPRRGGLAQGGGLYLAGEWSIESSTISANICQSGGGARVQSYPTLGGGLYNATNGSGWISQSTLSSNSAVGADAGTTIPGLEVFGGDAFGGGIYNAGRLSVTNSTLAANRVVGGIGREYELPSSIVTGQTAGAGVYVGAGHMTLINATLAGNIQTNTLGLLNDPRYSVSASNRLALASNLACTNGTLILINSLVANPIHGDNCWGTVIDGGFNISSDASCQFTGDSSVNETDPRLGPLQDNGGLTLTMWPEAGSPAIDFGGSSGTPPIDQRGAPRPQGALPDVGAVEWQPDISITWHEEGALISFWLPPNVRRVLQQSSDLDLWLDLVELGPFSQWTRVEHPIARNETGLRAFRLH